MRASVYDWMKQTPEHEAWASQAYPLIHDLAMNSDDWNDFCRSAQGLPPANKLRYVAEEGKWRTQFGDAWKAMGCLRETHIGQRSRGRNVYGGRTRGSLAGFGSYFRTPSYPRNVVAGLGAVSDRPPLPAGYVAYATPPESQISWKGEWESILGYWTWNRRRAAGPKGDCYIYLRNDLSDSFMAVGGGKVTISATDAKALQRALNEQYLTAGNALVVDGIIGPKTCTALHWFQYEYLGIDTAKINQQTYLALNLPLRFAQQYPDICLKYYTGVYGGTPPSEGGGLPEPTPAPTPEPEPIPEPPKPTSKAGVGILLGAVLGLTVIGAFVFRKKGKKGKK